MKDQVFGDLLTRALRSIVAVENKPMMTIEDEIGLEMGRAGRSAVEHWRKGNIPDPDTVERLANLCLGRGRLDTTWAERFRRSGRTTGTDKAISETLSREKNPDADRLNRHGSSSFDWVIVPAGEFFMGSDAAVDSDADLRECPQHLVYLPTYRIARVPVTVAQYLEFLRQTGYQPSQLWSDKERLVGKMNHPAVGVSWYDALEFCVWAHVRLPNEAEWEKAARGTDARKYPWGDQAPDRHYCNYDMNVGSTTPVGEYPRGASPYGVLDMSGNVWEWTSTLWGADTARSDFSYPWNRTDGRQNISADSSYRRILRGGAFDRYAKYMRVSARRLLSPKANYSVLGFRVACD